MKYYIYTDGSFKENDLTAGWAAIIKSEFGVTYNLSGHQNFKNSGEVEVFAAISAILFLPINSTIVINTDYETLANFNKNIQKWREKNYKTSRGIKVAQHWRQLESLLKIHKSITFNHIKRETNKEADRLANTERLILEKKIQWKKEFNSLFNTLEVI